MSRSWPARAFPGIWLLSLLLGCQAGRAPASADPTPNLKKTTPGRHVFIVVVDGLHPDAIGMAETPHLDRLIREGAFTLDARTIMPSATMPAFASLVTGLPPERHQVLWSEYDPDRGFVPEKTVFDLAHEAGLETALFAGKRKLLQLARPEVMGEAWIGPYNDRRIMKKAVKHIARERPGLVLIHLPEVDFAGHIFGWLGARQLRAVERADEALGLLIQTIETTGLAESSVVIVTSDHGGHGRNHGSSDPRDLTIPWIIWGAGVAPRELPRVNIMDTAAMALEALGLRAPPQMKAASVSGIAHGEAARPRP